MNAELRMRVEVISSYRVRRLQGVANKLYRDLLLFPTEKTLQLNSTTIDRNFHFQLVFVSFPLALAFFVNLENLHLGAQKYL